MSTWQDKLRKYLDEPPFETEEELEEHARYTPTEPGVTHPKNKSNMKIRDDGAIDIFAGEELGIRIDPNNDSINFFCEKFNVWSNQTLIHTESDQLIWNYWPINPYIYQMAPWDLQLRATYRFWDEHYELWRNKEAKFSPVLREDEKWTGLDKRYVNREQGILEDIFIDAVEDYGPPEEHISVFPDEEGDPREPKQGEGITYGFPDEMIEIEKYDSGLEYMEDDRRYIEELLEEMLEDEMEEEEDA